MKKALLPSLIVFALFLTLFAGCQGTTQGSTPSDLFSPSQSNTVSQSPSPSQYTAHLVETLKLEGGTDWGTPNPFLHQSRGPGQAKMKLVYASLLEKDEKGDVPWLAEKWSIDGKNYGFTLYEGATFHDGHSLTTDDIIFSIEYYKKHTPVSSYLGSDDKFIIESYKAVDARTIVITVKNPDADTLANLGSFVIIPKHIWENVDDPFTFTGDGYLVGSGAYMSTGYDSATGSYEFTAFDAFKGGKPAADRVLFIPVSDTILAFENGETDITSVPADLMDKYLNDKTIGVVNKANDSGYKLLINFEKCPDFLEIELRKAIYAALDRQAIVDKVFRGAGSVGSAGYVPEGTLYFNDDCVKYSYDAAAAKATFEGDGYELTILVADSGDDVSIAELIKIDLEAAGIKINVVSYDSATRDEKVNAGDYELALVGNGGWGNNPPSFMRTIFSDTSKNKGGNPHSMGPIGYSNAELTKLCEKQAGIIDFSARIEAFKEIQMLVSQEIPLIVVANKSTYSMYRSAYYDGWMKTYAYQQAEQNRLSFMER